MFTRKMPILEGFWQDQTGSKAHEFTDSYIFVAILILAILACIFLFEFELIQHIADEFVRQSPAGF